MIPNEKSVDRDTVFSPCRKYRYTLWREWDIDLMTGCSDDLLNSNKYVQFIGLNPSTADETNDDPTIRRCIGFSKAWGYGAFCMTNLFAFRATDPEVMKSSGSHVAGIDNQHHILKIAASAGIVVAAWGKHGKHMSQDLNAIEWMKSINVEIYHLGLNKDKTPKHPLYLKASTLPEKLKF